MSHTAHAKEAAPALQAASPGILRSKSNSDISTASSDSKTSSITFAPLPCIEGRKRRNSRPIGLASRAEMLQKTRRQFASHPHSYEPPPEDDDIPLPDIGKLVKGLWRTVSRGRKERDGDEVLRLPNAATTAIEGSMEENNEEEGGVWMEQVAWAPATNTILSAPFSREDHPS